MMFRLFAAGFALLSLTAAAPKPPEQFLYGVSWYPGWKAAATFLVAALIWSRLPEALRTGHAYRGFDADA